MSAESDMNAEMNILYALRRGERPKVEKPDNFAGVRAVTSWAPDYPIALVPEEEKAAVAALAAFVGISAEERADPRNWPSPRHLVWALAKLRTTRTNADAALVVEQEKVRTMTRWVDAYLNLGSVILARKKSPRLKATYYKLKPD